MKGTRKLVFSVTPIKRLIASLMVLSAGAIPAYSQLNDPDQVTAFWADWMVSPSILGPRFFINTERNILQTGPNSASFQSGVSEFILADDGVGRVWRDQIVPYFEEWDSDKDGWRDVVEESAEPPSNPFDPLSVPTGIAPDVFWLRLANGFLLPVNPENSSPATVVRPFAGNAVRLIAAPAASKIPRPLPLFDYSTQFYISNASGSPELLGLSLYGNRIEYPNPGDASKMENDIVEGNYQVEFPTTTSLYNKAGIWTGHRIVPNGTLTIGPKKPTWLLRSVETVESFDKPPVPRKWVNGRLQFDPELPNIFRWDDIVSAGLTSGLNDQLTVRIVDNDLVQIWPPETAPGSGQFFGPAVLSVASPQATLTMQDILPDIGPGNPLPPDLIEGFMEFQYSRDFLGNNYGDIATVTLRIPIGLVRSYASWRIAMFPGASSLIDSISGPNADPDGDGLTNQQEYLQGSDPTVATIGVTSLSSGNVTTNSATLGASVVSDPFSGLDPILFERGIVYSASSTNSSPLIDGAGVNRVAAFPAGLGDFTIDVGGLSASTQYSYRGYVISSVGTFYTTNVAVFTTAATPPVTLPAVTSPFSSGLAASSINLGGTVTSDGGSPLIETGVVYSVTSTNDNPFIDGTGVTRLASASPSLGTFSVNVTGLAASTTYSFRAYAINSVGTSHTTSIGTFTTPTGPTIISPTADMITGTSARLGGNVTNSGGLAVLARGVTFSSTNVNPDIGGAGVNALLASSSGLGVFTVNVTNLQPATLYYFKAFAINSVGTSYTTVGTFTTTGAVPTLASPTISNVTVSSAVLGATVSSDGQSPITERGFVYSQTLVNNNPLEGGTGVLKEAVAGTTGAYSATIVGLAQNTGYTFRPFARNSVGIAYGPSVAFFTTLPPLTVIDPTVSDVTDNSAILGGTVLSDSGTTVDERGVVYNTDPGTPPVIGGSGVMQATASGTMGPFTVNVAGLDPDTQYFFRAYAINSAGTSYSDISGFKTEPLALLGESAVEWLELVQQAEELLEAETLQAEAVQESTRRSRSFRSISDSGSTGDSGSQTLRSPTAIRTADGYTMLDSGSGTPQPATPFVPKFVYRKHESELTKPLSYVVEISDDSRTWKPAGDHWQVEQTADAISASWISPEPVPTRVFFRVKAVMD